MPLTSTSKYLKSSVQSLIAGVFLLASSKAIATTIDLHRLNVRAVDTATADAMIRSEALTLKTKGLRAADLEPDRKQSFEIVLPKTTLFYIPTVRESQDGSAAPWVCSVLLFNQNRKIVSVLDLVGSGDMRSWTCDGLSAVSFSDRYDDGSVLVIAIYNATAPSSARFKVPIILKLSLSPPELVVDEVLTRGFDDVDVTTIKKARSLLPKNR